MHTEEIQDDRVKLTIITPVHNCLKYTRDFISQIKIYTSNSYQLIIVNNGSTDGTSKFLKTFKNNAEIDVIENKYNRGYSYANNQGIQSAKGDYICFLNNDVMVFPSWDNHLINTLCRTGSAFVGPVTNSCAGLQCENYDLKDVLLSTIETTQSNCQLIRNQNLK